jgi:hypothetical protein
MPENDSILCDFQLCMLILIRGPASWSEFLTIDHEVPGSIPGSTMGIFP